MTPSTYHKNHGISDSMICGYWSFRIWSTDPNPCLSQLLILHNNQQLVTIRGGWNERKGCVGSVGQWRRATWEVIWWSFLSSMKSMPDPCFAPPGVGKGPEPYPHVSCVEVCALGAIMSSWWGPERWCIEWGHFNTFFFGFFIPST